MSVRPAKKKPLALHILVMVVRTVVPLLCTVQGKSARTKSCAFSLFSQLVIRVHLSDESSKTMMVDERQTVRQVCPNACYTCTTDAVIVFKIV